MRVTGWSVDGFGILHDYQKRDLPAGLAVFEGQNESGKSTLHDFLRGVLFGFPRVGRNKSPYYPPLNGGRHGGRLFVETAGGAITIEREVGRPPRITKEDGTILSDTEFQLLIGGVDAQMFRTVFAFCLDELRDFDSLSDEQVRARIFAAGVGGAGPSVRGVIQQLDKRAQLALKPRARDARVNSLLAEVIACGAELDAARRQAEDYPLLLEEGRVLSHDLQTVELREHGLRAVISRHERLQELWPAWHRAASARETLCHLEPVDEFVPDPLGRLAEVRQAMKSSGEVLSRLEDQRDRRQLEAADLRGKLRSDLATLRADVETQIDLLPLQRERGRELALAEGRARQDEDRVVRQLADLGPGYDDALLAQIDASLPRADEARLWKGKLTEATEARRRETTSLHGATLLLGKAESEHTRFAAALAQSEPPDEQGLEEKMEAVHGLQANLASLGAKQAAIEASDALLESTELLVELESNAGRIGRGRRWWLASGIVAVVLVAFALWAAVTGRTSDSIIFVAVIFALVAMTLVLSARGRVKSPGVPARRRQLEEGRAARQTLADEVARLQSSSKELAEVLGFPGLPDQDALDRLQVDVAAQRQALVRWQDQKLELVRLEERLEAARLEEGAARAALTRAEEDLSRLEAEFRANLEQWRLPSSLSPAGAEDFLRAVRSAKEQVERRDESAQTVTRLRSESAVWEEVTSRLLAAAGLDGSGQETTQDLLRLDELCGLDADIRSRLASFETMLTELETEIQGARADLARRIRDRDDLLKEAGAEDEADFQRRLEIFEERKELLRAVGEAEARLLEAVGRDAAADAFVVELSRGALEDWQGRLEEAQHQLTETREQNNELVKRQGDVERRLRELEESADVPALETRLQGLRTDLEDALREWRVTSLAASLVRETLSHFTRERQPFVLAEASEMFSKVTGGRYERILPSIEEDGIVLMSAGGSAKSPEQLSRGTMEQLYLCLRLGLAEEFSRRTESIPLLMDDVLVNFDEERRRVTAGLLADFARRHQVLLFTCHKDVVELLREVEPRVHIVAMG